MSVVSFGGVLLPGDDVSLEKWAVVACDQFTSEPEYWEKLKEWIGKEPSTLSLICPECYLSEAEKLLPIIREKSEFYAENVLKREVPGVIVKRQTSLGTRTGLVCKIDLEEYSYEPGAKSRIRATEKTVKERIPPRMEVRKASRLDVPHVLCLIDDRDGILKSAEKGGLLYSFDLSASGGHIEGYEIARPDLLLKKLDELDAETAGEGRPFILVGDGNHSLASAKAYYEELKKTGDSRAANARYALVEIESIYDESIAFEPIHRAVFGENALAPLLEAFKEGKTTELFCGEKTFSVRLPEDEVEAYNKVTEILDSLSAETGAKVDYIHGLVNLRDVCKNGAVGIVMPAIKKSSFFGLVAKHGVLPKKTFSMGNANEKRYYLECRDLGVKK